MLYCYGVYILGIVIAAKKEPLASQGGDLNSSNSVVTRDLEAWRWIAIILELTK